MVNYSGYLEVEVNDEDFALLEGGKVPASLGDLCENQYIIASDRFGKIEYFRYNDGAVTRVPFTHFENDFVGNIKPRNPQQYCAFHMLKDKNIPIKLITGKFGTGKAQPINTMIPTPDGERALGDLQPGDYVFARNGKKTKILEVFPQGVIDNYRVDFSDGRHAFCNNEHIWTCINEDGELFNTTLQEMINSFMLYNGEFYRIPRCGAIRFENVIEDRDVYQDGYLASCAIQKDIFTAPIDQRIRFVAGLIDGHGFIEDRRLYLKLRDFNLIKDVFKLFDGLGVYCFNADKPVDDNITAILGVSFTEEQLKGLAPYLYSFDLNTEVGLEEIPPLEITDIVYIGPTEMKCILVDNPEHTYITESYIVTHNTMAIIDAALEAVNNGDFDKIIYIRNNVQVRDTDNLGALPGDEYEKMLPYLMPFADHCGGVEGLKRLIDEDKLEVIPLGFLRGRSIRNAILYSMESENLTKEHIQLIMGRVDEGSQLLMDGDIKQRDRAAFEKSKGLETMIERLKGHKKFGYINLVKSERSEVAAMADLLDD